MKRFVIFSFISSIAKLFNAASWVFFLNSRWLELLGEENNFGGEYIPIVAEDKIEGVLDCSKLKSFDCSMWSLNPDPTLRVSSSHNFIFPFQLEEDSEGVVFKVILEAKALVGFIALKLPSSSLQSPDKFSKLVETLSPISYLLELVFQNSVSADLPKWQDFYAKCLNYSASASSAVLILGRLIKYDDLFIRLGGGIFELWRTEFIRELKLALSDRFVSFYIREPSYILVFCNKMSSAYYKKRVSAALKKSLYQCGWDSDIPFDFSWQNLDLEDDELDVEEALKRGYFAKLAAG